MFDRLTTTNAVYALPILGLAMVLGWSPIAGAHPASAHKAAVPAKASTLGTARQIAQERVALRILASEPMVQEIRRVEALYAADPQGKTSTGKATIQRAAQAIAMAAITYALAEDTDNPAILWAVNAPHSWFGLDVPRSGYGIDNPDNVYRNGMVDGASRYVIHGQVKQPGPAELHFEMRDAIPGTTAMAAEGGKQVSTLRSDQMQVDADGRFTVTIDRDPPNGRSNHLQIPAEGKSLFVVRDLFTNWATQSPVALDIERIGGPAIAAPPSEAQIARRAAALLAQIAPYWVAYDNQYVFTKAANRIITPRVRPGGRGFATSGHFSLADDQAWVITLDPLGGVSLGFQLTDPWGVAYEYRDRTSSLNTAQARPNADGSYTFVISKKDPGVYNWLDPEDHSAGIYAVRWQSLPADAKAEDAVRESKVVALDQLKRELPANTPFVTRAERKAQRAERARYYERRLTE